jgi:hypothetical protein
MTLIASACCDRAGMSLSLPRSLPLRLKDVRLVGGMTVSSAKIWPAFQGTIRPDVRKDVEMLEACSDDQVWPVRPSRTLKGASISSAGVDIIEQQNPDPELLINIHLTVGVVSCRPLHPPIAATETP